MKRPLIVGSALLFGTLSCYEAPTPPVEDGELTTEPTDASGPHTADTGSPDASQADLSVPHEGIPCLQRADQPCERIHEACCDGADMLSGQPLVTCEVVGDRMIWRRYRADQPEFCECDMNDALGYASLLCAVPGFVGITRGGRRARAQNARRLRSPQPAQLA